MTLQLGVAAITSVSPERKAWCCAPVVHLPLHEGVQASEQTLGHLLLSKLDVINTASSKNAPGVCMHSNPTKP